MKKLPHIHEIKPIMAIDPGLSGGVAWITSDGKTQAVRMPQTDADIVHMLTSIHRETPLSRCILEDVGGFIGEAQPGGAMFKFGFNCGFIRGVAMSLGVRVELVRPQKWQTGLGLGNSKSCASKAEWKRKLKGEAGRRFPDQKVTLLTADALLILDWARFNQAHVVD